MARQQCFRRVAEFGQLADPQILLRRVGISRRQRGDVPRRTGSAASEQAEEVKQPFRVNWAVASRGSEESDLLSSLSEESYERMRWLEETLREAATQGGLAEMQTSAAELTVKQTKE
eukprot:2878175-Pyramimonas_sp.AAC.1